MNEDDRNTLERLKRLRGKNKRLIRERTAAEVKMLVHDRLGYCVFGTMQLLDEGMDDAVLQTVTDHWEDVLNILTEGLQGGMLFDVNKALRELDETALLVGCRICYEGALPESARALHLMVMLLNEVLPNAVRHSHADEVCVAIRPRSDSVLLTITNNGPLQPDVIREGSGLSALRDRLESEGALLEFITTPAFEIHATIPL